MTAKHRKGKNNHKQEENFFKNEVLDSEVRSTGGNNSNNYVPLLGLFLLLVIGGAAGCWFCSQQHQTLTYLTDNMMALQMKVVKLQSSHEELRRSNDKPLSDGVENRLIALEDSYALAQKQVAMALATAEQLKTSDLPAQVLSLHTEMKSRLAEMQQATVSVDQLRKLQTMLRGNNQEFDGIRVQVDGLASLTGELSQKVDVLADSLGEAESKLEERAGQLVTLTNTLSGQAGEVLKLREQLDTYQLQLEASILNMAAVRELLEKEEAQQPQQASVEQQLDTVRQSLQDQNSVAQNLHSELSAQLESVQKQIAQLQGKTVDEAADEEEAAVGEEEEEEEVPAEEVAAEIEEGTTTPKEDIVEVEEGLRTDEEETEDAAPEETAPSEEEADDEMEQDEPVAVSETEELDTEAEVQSVEEAEEGSPRAEKEEVQEENLAEAEETVEEESQREEEEETASEVEEDDDQQDSAPEEQPQEMEDGEEAIEDDVSTKDE
ncbi:neurofilament medium polypeptide [Gouania willdenowi]|uniref:Neurofilament medium polypeptide-like n=1 Tax=Gouania willdenowi TaxID=441366 RepID=A0A8C5I7X1_GOUWI|nr:neurofilament medium polypeptide-like [Gouania willdenowi]